MRADRAHDRTGVTTRGCRTSSVLTRFWRRSRTSVRSGLRTHGYQAVPRNRRRMVKEAGGIAALVDALGSLVDGARPSTQGNPRSDQVPRIYSLRRSAAAPASHLHARRLADRADRAPCPRARPSRSFGDKASPEAVLSLKVSRSRPAAQAPFLVEACRQNRCAAGAGLEYVRRRGKAENSA